MKLLRIVIYTALVLFVIWLIYPLRYEYRGSVLGSEQRIDRITFAVDERYGVGEWRATGQKERVGLAPSKASIDRALKQRKEDTMRLFGKLDRSKGLNEAADSVATSAKKDLMPSSSGR